MEGVGGVLVTSSSCIPYMAERCFNFLFTYLVIVLDAGPALVKTMLRCVCACVHVC